MRLLIIGPQGAGKGTQAELLCEALDIPHISTGDLFRANIGQGTELGRRAKSYMDAGQLVPDAVTQDMVADRLAQDDAAVGFLLDGFPRNTAQATWLTGLLESRGMALDAVVQLQAPEEVLMERMLARGRADDTPEAIRTRLEIYHSETEPLVDYYGPLVAPVDGVGEVAAIHARVLSAVRETAGRSRADAGGADAGDAAP